MSRRRRRPGIALPAVLGVIVALGLLSSLALADAVRDWRVATLAEDAVRARAAALEALAAAAHPVDLEALCLSGPLTGQGADVPTASGTRGHVRPPSVVERMTNWPSTESLKAMPRFASQNAIASKNAFGSVLVNCSVHVLPASVVL